MASLLDPSSTAALGAAIGSLVLLAGQFDNHLWRIICVYASGKVLPSLKVYSEQPWYLQSLFSVGAFFAIWCVPHLRPKHKRGGCVVITGVDSGMGQATALYLAETNEDSSKGRYDKIFAAAFNAKEAQQKLQELIKNKDNMKHIQVVPLDVTKEDSVKQSAATVRTFLKEQKSYLAGIVNYHGIAYNGPLEYLPMSMYERQLDVNYLGNIRMCQAYLPMLRSKENSTSDFRRLVFTGTGGGPCSPCPSLLTAYMSSKFAGEAMAQSLKQELYMTQGEGPKIDISVINPGFVKPTQLMADGIKLSAKMWQMSEEKQGSSVAKDTYGKMMDHFHLYVELQPGTHVSEVAKAAEHALTAHSPRSSYKVGIDSKLAPIVGMLPTGARELIARHGIYGVLSPAKTVQGYQV